MSRVAAGDRRRPLPGRNVGKERSVPRRLHRSDHRPWRTSGAVLALFLCPCLCFCSQQGLSCPSKGEEEGEEEEGLSLVSQNEEERRQGLYRSPLDETSNRGPQGCQGERRCFRTLSVACYKKMKRGNTNEITVIDPVHEKKGPPACLIFTCPVYKKKNQSPDYAIVTKWHTGRESATLPVPCIRTNWRCASCLPPSVVVRSSI